MARDMDRCHALRDPIREKGSILLLKRECSSVNQFFADEEEIDMYIPGPTTTKLVASVERITTVAWFATMSPVIHPT